jgi:hypothetical protein
MQIHDRWTKDGQEQDTKTQHRMDRRQKTTTNQIEVP